MARPLHQGLLIDFDNSLIHNNAKTIGAEKQMAETLNHAYINNVEHATSNKPASGLHDTNIGLSSAKDLVINKYETHTSITKIKDSLNKSTCFILNKVKVQDEEKLIK